MGMDAGDVKIKLRAAEARIAELQRALILAEAALANAADRALQEAAKLSDAHMEANRVSDPRTGN